MGTIKRLDQTDVPQITTLINARPNILGTEQSQTFQNDYKARWLEGMRMYYLNNNDTHYLYGFYDDDGVLLSCIGWRSGLHTPYEKDRVVSHFKTLPGSSLRRNGTIDLWKMMFEKFDQDDLYRWHMLIPEKGHNRYQALVDRYMKNVDDSYNYHWSIIVPAGERPDVDWVWGSMGRIVHDKEIRVRTGVRK